MATLLSPDLGLRVAAPWLISIQANSYYGIKAAAKLTWINAPFNT
jgi:hypothetical protein